MHRTTLFIQPVAALVALILVATAAVPANPTPRDTLEKACDKAYEMYIHAEKKELDAVITSAQETLELTEKAFNELENVPGPSQSYTGDARDWLRQTIKDAQNKEANDAFEHAIKARGSLNKALDACPKN